MPERDTAVNTVVPSTPPRRSPRFLHSDTPQHNTSSNLRRSTRLSLLKKSSPDPEVPKSPEPRSDQVRFSETDSKKSSKSIDGSRNRGVLNTGSKNSVVLRNRVNGFSNLKRSPRKCQPFKKMPERDTAVNTVVPSTPRRRSPRFLHSDTPQHNTSSNLRRSTRLSLLKKSSPDPEVPKSPEPRSDQVRFSETDSKKSSKSIDGSRNRGVLNTGWKNSVVLRYRVNGFSNLKRSPRKCQPFKKMSKRDSAFNTVVPSTPRRRSPRFLHSDTPQHNTSSNLRRSTRLSLLKKSSPDPEVPKSPEPRSDQVRFSETDSKKSSKSIDGSRNRGVLNTGWKNSVVLRYRVNGFSNLKRSPRKCQPFKKMSKRDSAFNTVVPSTPRRRSPRFLHSDTPQHNTSSNLRRSTRLSLLKKSSPDPEVPKSPDPRSDQVRFSETDSKKSSNSIDGSRNRGVLSTESKNSVVLRNMVNGFSNLRRSPRLSEGDGFSPGKSSKKSGISVNGSSNRGNSSSGSIKSIRKNSAVDGFQGLRQSQRISSTRKDICYKDELSDVKEAEEFVVKSEIETRVGLVGPQTKEELDGECRVDGFQGLRRSQRISSTRKDICYKDELSDVEEAEEFVVKNEIKTRVALVGPQTKEELDGECRVVEVSQKRKRDECEESNGAVQTWTKEQELALKRAYLVAKPTPHFWKKVSELVPGKSAQECFNKINSDHLTPPQHQPVPRTKKRVNSSPIRHLDLSASKVLKPTEIKVKRPSFNKQKSHVLHKNARQLLRMHHQQNQNHEADLFSVLEPNLDVSTQAFQHSVVLSTPKHLQEKHGFLQKFNERSTSGHKKPLSRFSASCGKALSPPVLKQVKNKVLHEKYIDQLHSRDAKRKTASEQAKNSTLTVQDRKEINVPKSDVVRAARNALVSDAIGMLQQIQSNAKSNSSDLDDDYVFQNDGDETETEI